MPFKLCRCGKVIPYNQTRCMACEAKYKEQRKQDSKAYDSTVRNQDSKEFYRSKAWRTKRDKILATYFRIDLYAYYIEDRMIDANTVHHIIPLNEDRSKALDDDNLFPCSVGTNKLLDDGLYKTNKEQTQKLLRELLDRARKEFGIQ